MPNPAASSMYLKGSIGRTMLKTGLSMLPATVAIIGYNLADTWFVGRLGVLPLAAMSFTFPVVALFGCVFRGVAVGIMTPAAHALGAGNLHKAAGMSSAGLAFNFLFSIMLAIIGIACMEPVFRLVGAEGEALQLVRDYMVIWYLGTITGSAGIVCNDLVIAAGAPKIASMMTLLGLGLNVILDPIMIFGFGPVPAMGITGAAWATVISQTVGLVVLLRVLHVRFHLLTRRIRDLRLLRTAWGGILRVAVPTSLGLFLMPIGAGVVTRAVAKFGETAVAGAGAAGRLECIAFWVPMSIGIALMPMVAQNYGAHDFKRIDRCRIFSLNFAGWYLFAAAILCSVFARPFAALFTEEPAVVEVMVHYLRIISWGFGMNEIHRFCTFFLTGCDHPRSSAVLNGMRVVVFLIPFTLIAVWIGNLDGIFWARLLSDLASGVIGIFWVRHMTRGFLYGKKQNKLV